jgi:hypothetical protein
MPSGTSGHSGGAMMGLDQASEGRANSFDQSVMAVTDFRG